MSNDPRPAKPAAKHSNAPAEYEAPRIETKLTASDLEREALYAGNGISIIDGPR